MKKKTVTNSTAGKTSGESARGSCGIAGAEALEESIGYRFSDRSLLTEALTHSSYSYEHGGQKVCPCNERLEFLGDSVLSVIVSEYLFENYPDSPEGDLTRCRSELVCERALSSYAGSIGLGEHLRLGKGEEKGGGRSRPSLLCDAYEALLAAVYLDSGAGDAGKRAVSGYVMPSVIERLGGMLTGRPVIDYKTLLQETVQTFQTAHDDSSRYSEILFPALLWQRERAVFKGVFPGKPRHGIDPASPRGYN